MNTADTPTAPWEQQPDESSAAFGAFVLFRDLGPKRTLEETARVYHRRPAVAPASSPNGHRKKASGRIREWAQQYRWRERARAWDEEVDRQAREAQVEAVKGMHRRHAEEAQEFQKKALERLREIPLDDLDAGAVIRFFTEAVKIERLARGEPETVQEQRQKADRNERDITHLVLTDPHAAALACELFERVAAGPPDAGRAGLVGEPAAVEAGPSPQPAQPPPA